MATIVPADLHASEGLVFPTMYEAHRVYSPEEIPEVAVGEIPAEVRRQLLALQGRIRPGARVGIATGSRGLANFPAIIRACGEAVRAAGGEPFILPAMGSHGGATAEGQREVLLGYGLTPEAMDMEIVSSMEVERVGTLPQGMEVYVSTTALQADHVLLVNRIKPHTDFRGPIESGLTKICTIGLGKQRGAESIHHSGLRGLTQYMTPAARYIIEHTGKVIGGLGVLENALDHTASVHWVEPQDIGGPGEEALQARSKQLLATIPFDVLDVLVVEEMGKNIAGTGIDTNVVGRVTVHNAPEFGPPDIAIVAVLDLTPESHGNAVGIGVADVTTDRLIQMVDWQKVWMNSYTSGFGGVVRAKIPMVFKDDKEAVAAAIQMCGEPHADKVRLVWIKNTLDVAHLYISSALLPEAAERRLEVAHQGTQFRFDEAGRLVGMGAHT